MNALSSSKCFGVLTVLLICTLVPQRPPVYGSHEACPLGGCGGGHAPADPPAPQVTMKVRVPAAAHPGRELEYRVFLENTGAGAAHHVIVKCPLPAHAKFVRASPAPHQQEPELQWHLGTMRPVRARPRRHAPAGRAARSRRAPPPPRRQTAAGDRADPAGRGR
jgi:uncharacterized repeat protein (TIGR01451 family)